MSRIKFCFHKPETGHTESLIIGPEKNTTVLTCMLCPSLKFYATREKKKKDSIQKRRECVQRCVVRFKISLYESERK